MRFVKNKLFKKAAPLLLVPMAVVLAVTLLVPQPSNAQLPLLDPDEVRVAVQDMGMDSLATVILNLPVGYNTFVRLQEPPLAGDTTTDPPVPAVPQSLINYARAKGLPVQRAALLILGKALFFDQQAGSDGQACASCHFIAGTDNRITNTLNPGSRNTNITEANAWNTTRRGLPGAPNYTLTPADFPFHELADPLETNYGKRDVLFDTDDAVGSIGAFHVAYAGSPAPNYNTPNAVGTYDTPGARVIDIFTVGGRNMRSNGPRQAATMINAVFQFRNFWDGRADNNFNGLNGHGVKDQNAFIYFNGGASLVRDLIAGPADSALASQAVFPPNSATSDEMAFRGRTMQDLGRKMLRLTGPGSGATATANIDPVSGNLTSITVNTQGSNYIHGATVTIIGGGGAGATATAVVTNGAVTAINVVTPGGGFITPPLVEIISTGLDTAAYVSYTDGINPVIIPLGAQLVHPADSVLGNGSAPGFGSWTFKNPGGTNSGRGINMRYVNLIQWAFNITFWDGTGPADANGLPTTLLTPGGFTLMEENFAAFWGVAIQEYESTLRADQTPFDKFMGGDNNAFGPWDSPQAQTIMQGLLTYIHTEASVQQVNPLFNNINFGACQLCHSGPELTENTLTNVPLKFFVTTDMTVKMDHNRELAIVAPGSNFDVGFSNVGTRPNREDVGIGADASPLLPGVSLSIARALFRNETWPIVFIPAVLFPARPNLHRGSNIDGSFKIPHLRNIELMGPYFHHGGSLTLKQAVEFYARHGDFADVNDPDIDVGLAMVQNIGHEDADLIVAFLLSLTDERVRWEMAPFDHPQLFIPNGHTLGNRPGGDPLGNNYYPDVIFEYPAVGAGGRAGTVAPVLPNGVAWPAGNAPLPNFLGISSTPVADPIPFGQPGYVPNDHFDP